MATNELPTSARQHEDHWIPLSDLMSGLMMFFMLLAIVFMVKVEADKRKIEADKSNLESDKIKIEAETKRVESIAVLYDQLRNDLYRDLEKEFHSDLPRWGAELETDLTIRFKEPDVLFDTGKDTLKPRFRAILDDFFPRYIRVLSSEKYRTSITEIRIEGHTSSIWNKSTTEDDAYFLNMGLSQARTRSVLHYVLELPTVQETKPWVQKLLTANGLSSSKLITNADGTENFARSQRVEFRVRTDAEA